MRSSILPISERIPAARQRDTRHYGVHPYFTRRPPNVVRKYIERYSQPGDAVLDPFGGTGVTAIEAFLLGRDAIQNDLNPFANFIARSLVESAADSIAKLKEAFGRIEDASRARLEKLSRSDALVAELMTSVPLPENVALPQSSDAERFFDLFTPRQLLGLALLKQAIDSEVDPTTRNLLLLAWSASVAKLNKTFLSAKGRAASRGGSSIFSIYRYKLAKEVVELPIWETFEGRFKNVLAAVKEVIRCREEAESKFGRAASFRVLSEDAAVLDTVLGEESVDYIFTDPPYGAFISYLDLSVMWNHWLNFGVSEEDCARETIVGGEHKLTEDHYKQSLERSVQACLRMLKPDRWLSIVFQHWDVSYFEAILDSATAAGADFRAAITQTDDVIWSMHKKKNSASVLGGELILTFYKPRHARQSQSNQPTVHRSDANAQLQDVLDACLPKDHSEFTHEVLFNRIVIELWSHAALKCLQLDRRVFAAALEERGWFYDPARHRWIHEAAVATTSTFRSLFPDIH